MKKNPFNGPVKAARRNTLSNTWHVVWGEAKCAHMLILNSLMSQEQARYAAEAINKHEEAMAMLEKHQWVDSNTFTGYLCPECKAAFLAGHADDCELAALLKKENRDG